MQFTPRDFLIGIFNALGSKETNIDRSQYFSISRADKGSVSLRVANHRASAKTYLDNNNAADEKLSLVVKMSEKPFEPNGKVRLTEYVYFADKLTAEQETGIANAIANLIEGKNVVFPKAHQVNASPRVKKDEGAGRVGPSQLGDGKQRYYEVPFAKAVDKIVKAKKPIGDEHVFVSETPEVFSKIGFPRLPIMMTQKHVLSISSDADSLKALKISGNAHDMKNVLKQIPKALQKPLMVIASKSKPDVGVVAITRLVDKDGRSVIVPVAINGLSRIGGGAQIDAHIMTSAYGKDNAWSKLVVDAIEAEAQGKVGVFYIDNTRASMIRNQLARAMKNQKSGTSRLQLPSGSFASDFVHSITDPGSPVNTVGMVDQTASRQFKRWFGKSKVVNRAGQPQVVYHGTPNGKFWTFDKNRVGETWGADETGFFFTSSKVLAEDYTKPYFKESSADPNLFSVYLSIQNPLVIDRAWWQKNFGRSDIHKHDAVEIWDNEQRTILDAMREGGHDGVIIDPNPMAGEPKMYMVPEPNQIKSATDNIGTFDSGNNDIRLSRAPTTPMGREVFVAGRARVADDAERGERLPGVIAASAELSGQIHTPISQAARSYSRRTTRTLPTGFSRRLTVMT